MNTSITPPVPVKHYLQFKDFSADDYAYLLARAWLIKQKFKTYQKHHTLTDRTLAMIFEKASTRTRVSFEAGMYQMGGSVVHLTTGDSQLGRAEPVEDSARVISRMVDLVMIRTYEQAKLEAFAAHSRVPVINGLTNEYHPCQILADIYTFIEHRGAIQGKTVAWIGDSNNVCNTWLQAAEVLDFNVHVSTPPGYEVEPERAGLYGTDHFEQFADPMDAARGADLVTTEGPTEISPFIDPWMGIGGADGTGESIRTPTIPGLLGGAAAVPGGNAGRAGGGPPDPPPERMASHIHC
jgi:ornithine carbamoyltransferase